MLSSSCSQWCVLVFFAGISHDHLAYEYSTLSRAPQWTPEMVFDAIFNFILLMSQQKTRVRLLYRQSPKKFSDICVIEKSWGLRLRLAGGRKKPEGNGCSTLWLVCSHNRSETRDQVIKSKAPSFSFLFLHLKALPPNSSILSRGVQPKAS